MTDFKVGDRVEVIDYLDCTPDERNEVLGKFGTVTRGDEITSFMTFLEVCLDGYTHRHLFLREELKLVPTLMPASHSTAWYEAELDRKDAEIQQYRDWLDAIREQLPAPKNLKDLATSCATACFEIRDILGGIL